jgi:thymidine kinase
LALKGIRVIVAGLDMDYLGNPFGQMPNLLARADYITKLHAICMKCGNIANISYRKTTQEEQVLLGEKETYEPRCRKCANEK